MFVRNYIKTFLCSLIFLFVCSFAQAQVSTLNVGYFDLPPHGTTQDSKPKGVALDYFSLIAKEMGVKVRFIQRPLPRLLVDQDIDMILYLGRTEEREKKFVFASQALYKMQGTVTFRSDSPFKAIKSAEDFEHLKIAVWQDGYISALLRNSNAELKKMTGDQVAHRALMQVASGRLNAFYSPDPYTVYEEIKRMKLRRKLRVLNLPEPAVDLSSAFTKAGAEKYLNSFEAAYAKVLKQHEYIQYLKSHLK